jgi:hypothetical protein
MQDFINNPCEMVAIPVKSFQLMNCQKHIFTCAQYTFENKFLTRNLSSTATISKEWQLGSMMNLSMHVDINE